MKLIYKHENMMVLHSVRNILEMNNISCYVKNQYGHTMGPEFGLSNTLLELWLNNANDYDKAEEIIKTQLQSPNAKTPPPGSAKLATKKMTVTLALAGIAKV